MKDILYLSNTPIEEHCAQVGRNQYLQMAKMEAHLYLCQLTDHVLEHHKQLHVSFARKTEQHDFGPTICIVIEYDPNNPKAVEQAFWVESNEPRYWSPKNKKAIQEYAEKIGYRYET